MLFSILLSSSLLSEQVLVLVVRAVLTLFMGNPTHTHNMSPGGEEAGSLVDGSFHLATTHNFDAYLAELGVNVILRQLASLANPTVTVSRLCPEVSVAVGSKDCIWNIFTDTPFRTHSIHFRLNEKVSDLTMDGRETQSVFQLVKENTLVEFQEGAVNTTITREFTPDAMIVHLMVNQVTANSTFLRTKAPASEERGSGEDSQDDLEDF